MAPNQGSTEEVDANVGITTPFLQKILTEEAKTKGQTQVRKILSTSVNLGTKPGDNYMSIIYSADVNFRDANTRHLLIKCYPTHPSRQEMNNRTNIFYKELRIYDTWIPELRQMQTDVLGLSQEEMIPIPYPPYIYGECIDFNSEEGQSRGTVPLQSLDNYIIMEDIRKAYGFKNANRRNPLDLNHMKLVMKALASVHALSWAYKHHVEKDIVKKFPFLGNSFKEEDLEMWKGLLNANVEMAKGILDKEFGPGNMYTEATEKLKAWGDRVNELFLGKTFCEGWENLHRLPPDPKRFGKDAENPQPWRILTHGDCWTNNMLFRYDMNTGRPAELTLVDLQIATEGCIVSDLQYVTYACTEHNLRKEHMDDLLQLYHDTFNNCCKTLRCPTLPGFCMDSLKYRFHRSKPLGFFMAIVGLPIMLKEEDKVVNLDDMDKNKDIMDAFTELCDGSGTNDKLKERLINVVKDMVNDGVF